MSNNTNNNLSKLQNIQNIKAFRINFGPQHPAAHGVLRLILLLQGEIVQRAEPHIGLLHRGTEKLLEHKTYLQGLPYFDRLDYVSMMSQEHVFALAVEKLMKKQIPLRAQYIRVIYSELTRILNHLMSITTHALDVGAFTPFLWGFEEREQLFELYEKISGARMHAAFFRPGGVAKDLSPLLIEKIYKFVDNFASRIDEIETLLTDNVIWKQRLINVGKITKQAIMRHGFTGVIARGSGIPYDLRYTSPYELYKYIDFNIPVGKNGDCYDRYLVRIQEMRESLSIIHQALSFLSRGPIRYKQSRKITKNSMEELISHFKNYTSYGFFDSNEDYTAIEAPKGELGVYLW